MLCTFFTGEHIVAPTLDFEWHQEVLLLLRLYASIYERWTNSRAAQRPDNVDRAVEHICFLADVNRLYDNALGLYDLDLTLLVAQQSQKVFRPYHCPKRLRES